MPRDHPDLFHAAGEARRRRDAPLADRLRPRDLSEFVGHEAIVGPGRPFRTLLEADRPTSVIFWGPPGTGKTTLARIIAHRTRARFASLSAVTSGIKEVRALIEEARVAYDRLGQGTVLFVDEIHRFNKAQQDAFLPHVEDGTIVLVGATTENPSFEVIPPLLSRTRVFVLEPLGPEALRAIIDRALADGERGLGGLRPVLEADSADRIIALADGDARRALNLLEVTVEATAPGPEGERRVTAEAVTAASGARLLRYDRAYEEHYNTISALHKSLRGSDPQAALYWLARMLEGGEDPLYIARRIVRFASEDVGNADPQALVVALAAKETVDFLGMPEADNALAQAVIYLATAPKSNAVYLAYGAARQDVRTKENRPVPLHIRNAPTALMKDVGYGKDYRYPHDYTEGYVAEDYLPDNLMGARYYRPTSFGFEREIGRRMDYWERLKRKARGEADRPDAAPEEGGGSR